MKYDAAYFIAKFEPIPDELWTVGTYRDTINPSCRCALGHCGEWESDTEESTELASLAYRLGFNIPTINDGKDAVYMDKTPKARILAFLRDAQKAGL